jgi:hypothetical protein
MKSSLVYSHLSDDQFSNLERLDKLPCSSELLIMSPLM